MTTFNKLSKSEWIERYGGQAMLDSEHFAVVPCDPSTCGDPVCNGWRVVKINRYNYMGGLITHDQFFEHIAKLAGIDMRDSPHLQRVKDALAAGDEYLNSIPMAEWDAWAIWVRPYVTAALKQCGDFYCLANGVCTLKAAAKVAARNRLDI